MEHSPNKTAVPMLITWQFSHSLYQQRNRHDLFDHPLQDVRQRPIQQARRYEAGGHRYLCRMRRYYHLGRTQALRNGCRGKSRPRVPEQYRKGVVQEVALPLPARQFDLRYQCEWIIEPLGGFPLGAAEVRPINVWAQVFAAHRSISGFLNFWAMFGRNWANVVNPLINSRKSQSKNCRQLGLTAENFAGFANIKVFHSRSIAPLQISFKPCYIYFSVG